MPYPTKLQPRRCYKIVKSNLTDYFLIRHTNTCDLSKLVNAQTGNVELSQFCHPTEQMNDFSTSLLGVFKVEHTKIKLLGSRKDYFNDYCKPDDKVDIPQDELDYTYEQNRHFFILPINKINGMSVPGKRAEKEFIAICRLVHTPARWNYWHFSIQWEVNGELITNEKNNEWKRRLLSIAKAMVSQFASIEAPIVKKIPPNFYKRNFFQIFISWIEFNSR